MQHSCQKGKPAPLDDTRQQGGLRQGQTNSSNPMVGYRASRSWMREPELTEVAEDLGQRLEAAAEAAGIPAPRTLANCDMQEPTMHEPQREHVRILANGVI